MPKATGCHHIPVWLDHDGNMDDAAALMTMLNLQVTKKRIGLLGVSMVPADSLRDSALTMTLSLMHYFGVKAPVSASTDTGKNPFPQDWREQADAVFKKHWTDMGLPLITPDSDIGKQYGVTTDVAGQMQSVISKAGVRDREMVVVLTGPPTNFVKALRSYPDIANKVKEVVWMGGAFRTAGNVEPNNMAEWNVYWDPPSSAALLQQSQKGGFPVIFVPLDVCNHLPTKDFLQTNYSAYGCWPKELQSMFKDIQAEQPDVTYYLWDVTAVMAAFYPELFGRRSARVEVVTSGKSEGQTKEAVAPRGIPADIVGLAATATPSMLFRQVLATVDFT